MCSIVKPKRMVIHKNGEISAKTKLGDWVIGNLIVTVLQKHIARSEKGMPCVKLFVAKVYNIFNVKESISGVKYHREHK